MNLLLHITLGTSEDQSARILLMKINNELNYLNKHFSLDQNTEINYPVGNCSLFFLFQSILSCNICLSRYDVFNI